jgi:hypothetical protein
MRPADKPIGTHGNGFCFEIGCAPATSCFSSARVDDLPKADRKIYTISNENCLQDHIMRSRHYLDHQEDQDDDATAAATTATTAKSRATSHSKNEQ